MPRIPGLRSMDVVYSGDQRTIPGLDAVSRTPFLDQPLIVRTAKFDWTATIPYDGHGDMHAPMRCRIVAGRARVRAAHSGNAISVTVGNSANASQFAIFSVQSSDALGTIFSISSAAATLLNSGIVEEAGLIRLGHNQSSAYTAGSLDLVLFVIPESP